jgi:hypothetical protein
MLVQFEFIKGFIVGIEYTTESYMEWQNEFTSCLFLHLGLFRIGVFFFKNGEPVL